MTEEMKTTEILDKFEEDISDEDYDKFDKELLSRNPFQYIMETIESMEERLSKLESNFNHHDHKDGSLIKKL